VSMRIVLMTVLWLVSNVGAAQSSRVVGTVLINNPNSYEVTILTQRMNAFGVKTWRDSTVVRGGYRIELPKVPEGALLGFRKTDDRNVTWPPISVLYTQKEGASFVFRFTIPVKDSTR
jgi:hypothetical protein